MTARDIDTRPIEEPLAELERHLTTAYLLEAGYDYQALLARGDDEARRLLAHAALYASERLSEIESRARYIHQLHGQD